MKRREELDTDADVCRFCYPSRDEDILYEDENVYVMPSLGQFTEGYLLLINKEHEECFGRVIDPERKKVKDRIRDVLEEEYGSWCFFEHGRVGSCLERGEKKICYHAHLHCLPVKKDFSDRLDREFKKIEVDEMSEIKELAEEHPHYFYLETFNGAKNFYIVEKNVERQYLRKRACEALGLPTSHANWRENPFKDRMEATVDRLKDKIAVETRPTVK